MNRAWMLDLHIAAPRLLLAGLIVLLGAALAILPLKWAMLLLVGSIALPALLVKPEAILCLLALAVPFGSVRGVPLGPLNVSGAELLIALLLGAWFARMVAARRIWLPHGSLLLPLLLFVAVLLLSLIPATSVELAAKEIVKWLEVAIIYCFMAGMVGVAPSMRRPDSASGWQELTGERGTTGKANGLGAARPCVGSGAERWGRWVVLALLTAGSVEALVGIYQFVRGVGPEGFVLFGRFMRAYGHFAQPNPFAGYLGLTVPLAYALTLHSVMGWWLWLRQRVRGLRVTATGKETRMSAAPAAVDVPVRQVSAASKARPARLLVVRLLCAMGHALPLASLCVMSLAMLMSWSRGGWVGLTAAIFVVTLVHGLTERDARHSASVRGRRGLVIGAVVGLAVACVLLAGAAGYLPSALVQRMADLLPFLSGVDVVSVEVNDANWALVERMAHWLAAVNMWTDHPWLGVGIGNYPVAYPQYALGRWRDPLGHAHNYYLNIAAEAGLLGLGAYLILFAACLAAAWRAIRRTRGYWRAVALGALGVLVHLCTHSLFDNLFVHSMNVQLGLILGLLLLSEQFGVSRHVHEA